MTQRRRAGTQLCHDQHAALCTMQLPHSCSSKSRCTRSLCHTTSSRRGHVALDSTHALDMNVVIRDRCEPGFEFKPFDSSAGVVKGLPSNGLHSDQFGSSPLTIPAELSTDQTARFHFSQPRVRVNSKCDYASCCAVSQCQKANSHRPGGLGSRG